jgi:hypothetical protein
VQVVVVVRDLADGDGKLGVHVLGDLVGLHGAVVLGQTWETDCVHPCLHHEAPSGQCNDWAEERLAKSEWRRHFDLGFN